MNYETAHKHLACHNLSDNKGKFIIGSANKVSGEMSMSANPRVHKTMQEAMQEAERLAKLDQTKKFIIFTIGRNVTVDGVVWG